MRCTKCGEIMKEIKVTQKQLIKDKMQYMGVKLTDTKYKCKCNE